MIFEILPALVEVFKLLGIVAVAVAAILLFVQVNFTTFRSPFYLPIKLTIAACVYVYIYHNISKDVSMLAFFTAMPVLTAFWFKFVLKGRFKTAMMFIAPSVAGVLLLFIYPLVFDIYLAFHKLNLESLNRWITTGSVEFVGFDNFVNVFNRGGETRESFLDILGRTFSWTIINLVFHVGVGVFLAILLNQKIRFTGIYRTLLILPWAIPQLIAVLAWRGEFHSEYGYVNHLIETINNLFSFTWNNATVYPLHLVGITKQEWWTNPDALFASVCIVNIWLGIPFMMVIALSGLQAISKSYYEAASIDGASSWQQFRKITLPLLKPVMVPSAILGMIWTFNNINVIYLMTAQKGGSEGADILVSDLYKQAFTFNRYSFSAAYALVVFCILLILTLIWINYSKVADSTR